MGTITPQRGTTTWRDGLVATALLIGSSATWAETPVHLLAPQPLTVPSPVSGVVYRAADEPTTADVWVVRPVAAPKQPLTAMPDRLPSGVVPSSWRPAPGATGSAYHPVSVPTASSTATVPVALKPQAPVAEPMPVSVAPPVLPTVLPPATPWRWYGYGVANPMPGLGAMIGAGKIPPGPTISLPPANPNPDKVIGPMPRPVDEPRSLWSPDASTPEPPPAPLPPTGTPPRLGQPPAPLLAPSSTVPTVPTHLPPTGLPIPDQPRTMPYSGSLPPTGVPIAPSGHGRTGPGYGAVLPNRDHAIRVSHTVPEPHALEPTVREPIVWTLAPEPLAIRPVTGQADRAVTPPIELALATVPAASSPPLAGLRDRVATACQGQADQVDVIRDGPSVVRVRFRVPRADWAEPLANRIAALPELKEYRVEFEVQVGS